MDIKKSFATDPALETEGVWTDIGEGAELLVARAGNKNYRRVMTKLYEKNRRILDLKNEVSEEKAVEIVIAALAETILLGWRGEVTYDGVVISYTRARAEMLLAHADFRKMVEALADDMNRYRLVEEERALGN